MGPITVPATRKDETINFKSRFVFRLRLLTTNFPAVGFVIVVSFLTINFPAL